MKKETILLIVVTLVVGCLVGMIVSQSSNKSSVQKPIAASAPAVDYQQKIKILKEVVGREPANHNAWVQLGHNFFDSGQQMDAIEAYDKALELDANDPNVLTDQGVMYRQVGWFDKAVNNFIKANKLNPNHPQSLFNLGLVYRDDLQDTQKAKEAWTRYLEIDPTGKSADNVRVMLDHMENGH